MRELAERDHGNKNAADGEHREHDLAPLFCGRLNGQQRVEERGEHGGNLPQAPGRSTMRSPKFAELLPNSHQPCTHGCTNAVLRP